MRQTFRGGLATVAAAFVLLAVAGPLGATHQVTIDFSTHGFGVFDPRFYEAEGIVFPLERCGSAGCDTWFVGHVQDFDALVGNTLLGPITATFTAPVSSLSMQVAPSLQGTAEYTLTAFASGSVVARASVTVTEDTGDPADTGFGYFTIDLGTLPRPATSFTLDSRFVRSSFPITNIEYAVRSIAYGPSHSSANTCGAVRGDGRLATNSLTRFVFYNVTYEADAPAPTGEISFSDRAPSPRIHFESTAITTLVISGSHVELTGTGAVNGLPVDFIVEGDDRSPDTFSIQLSNGYSASGAVAAGRGVNLKLC